MIKVEIDSERDRVVIKNLLHRMGRGSKRLRELVQTVNLIEIPNVGDYLVHSREVLGLPMALIDYAHLNTVTHRLAKWENLKFDKDYKEYTIGSLLSILIISKIESEHFKTSNFATDEDITEFKSKIVNNIIGL